MDIESSQYDSREKIALKIGIVPEMNVPQTNWAAQQRIDE